MSGLFLLAVLAILSFMAILVARRIARPIRNTWLRMGATALLTVVFMTLLVVDELIGGYQFSQLCRKNAVLRIDPEKARGRTVTVVNDPLNTVVPWSPVRIYHSRLNFRDAKTNEPIADYDWYTIRGGWFIRLLGISEGNAPLTIGRPGCSPPNSGTIPQRYGFTLSN
ncbi:MAG: hypothetical protein OEL20_19265 [Sulfuritalea sp.]|nr:hypothetical protein [Sulfuritalea sp.]